MIPFTEDTENGWNNTFPTNPLSSRANNCHDRICLARRRSDSSQ